MIAIVPPSVYLVVAVYFILAHIFCQSPKHTTKAAASSTVWYPPSECDATCVTCSLSVTVDYVAVAKP